MERSLTAPLRVRVCALKMGDLPFLCACIRRTSVDAMYKYQVQDAECNVQYQKFGLTFEAIKNALSHCVNTKSIHGAIVCVCVCIFSQW